MLILQFLLIKNSYQTIINRKIYMREITQIIHFIQSYEFYIVFWKI